MPSISTKDVINELPSGIAETARNIGNFFVKSGQASLRLYSALGPLASLGTSEPLTPSTPFQKQLYGTDKPITLRSVGAELGLNEKGKVAPFAGFALAAADLIPGGKITKNTAVGLLKNANKVDDAFRVLKQMMGVADDVAKKFAPIAAKTTDVKQLAGLVDDVVRESQDVVRIGKKIVAGVKGLTNEQIVKNLVRNIPQPGSTEELIEKAGGWKFPGFRQVFDEAMNKKNVELVRKLLPDVPQEYAKKFSKNIDDILEQGDKFRERGFITSVKEAFPDQSSKVAGQYIPRSTDELAIKARNLIIDDIQEATKTAMTGSDDKAVATASELIKHYADEAANATDTAIKATMEDKMAEVANSIAHTLTESGRTSQAASILGRMTPEGQVRFAAREIQKFNEAVKASKSLLAKEIPELTGQQAGNIVRQMKLIADMPDDISKAKAFKKLQDEVLDLVPSPLMKKIVTVWKAGLMTGLKTSGLNILSTVGNASLETIKDIPTAVVDNVASVFTGKRTATFTLRGFGKGAIDDGFKKGWTYLKTGFDEAEVAQKLDYKHVSFVTPNASKAVQAVQRQVQKYEELVFKIVGSEDYPVLYGAKARSMYDQAFAQGKNIGLKGQDLLDFANDIVKNPTEEMIKIAGLDSAMATFHNKTVLGYGARYLQNLGEGTRAEGIAEFVIPFSRTPAAVAMQVVNYSPVGVAKTIIGTILTGIKKGTFDQRAFSQGIGRGITGTGIMYLGTKLFDSDLVTLDFPKDEREQELWKLEGRKANSIKIGDKWRTAQSMGPAGNLILTGAYLMKGIKETGSVTAAMAQATFGGIQSIKDQTFLQGLSNFTNAYNDPNRYGEVYFGNFLGSFVPTLVSDVGRAKDLTERRTRTIEERIEARIPFLRESLEPKVDILGKEQKMGGNILETMADPTRPSKDISMPLVKELRRLNYAGFKVSPTLLGDKNGYKTLEPEQNTKLWKRTGEILSGKLDNLIKSPQYLALSEELKAKNIEKFTADVQVTARAELFIELTNNLTRENAKAVLEKQKYANGGFVTQEVFKRYLELR